MFNINKLSKKVAELEEQLYWTKCMIYDLQNPYNLSIGQKVNIYEKTNQLSVNLKEPNCEGVVVSMKHNYHKKTPYYETKHRVNYYTIYNYSTKSTKEFTDDLYLFEIIN